MVDAITGNSDSALANLGYSRDKVVTSRKCRSLSPETETAVTVTVQLSGPALTSVSMSRRRSPMPAFATSVLTQTVQRRMQLALWPGPRSLQVLYSSCHLCYSNPISIAGSLSRAIRIVVYFRGPRSIQENNRSKRLQTN